MSINLGSYQWMCRKYQKNFGFFLLNHNQFWLFRFDSQNQFKISLFLLWFTRVFRFKLPRMEWFNWMFSFRVAHDRHTNAWSLRCILIGCKRRKNHEIIYKNILRAIRIYYGRMSGIKIQLMTYQSIKKCAARIPTALCQVWLIKIETNLI